MYIYIVVKHYNTVSVSIPDLKPRVAAGLMPGLPSYLLFMCVRHTDYINDDEKVRAFLTNTINSIKKVVKVGNSQLFVNTYRLVLSSFYSSYFQLNQDILTFW